VEGTEYKTDGAVVRRKFQGWENGAEVLGELVHHNGHLYFLNYCDNLHKRLCVYNIAAGSVAKLEGKFA
jgi:hypothetical protein